MGTDIHPAIEVQKGDPFRSWTLVAYPDATRNYELFNLLAAARHEDATPWVAPRGLPADMDYRSRVLCGGDHTASWVTLEEARGFKLPAQSLESTRHQWGRWLQTMEFYADLYAVAPDRVRVVFNFDS